MTNVDPVDIEWLGLKAGDLSDNAVVIQCSFRSASHAIVSFLCFTEHKIGMKKPRGEGGLGLPTLCKGNNIVQRKQRTGGYGIVSCMKLPEDTSKVVSSKAINRAVRTSN